MNQSWIQAVQCLIGTTTYRRIDYITSFLRMISYIMKGNGKKKKFSPETFMTHYLVNIYQFRVDWAFWSIISSREKRSPGAPELGLIVKVFNGPVSQRKVSCCWALWATMYTNTKKAIKDKSTETGLIVINPDLYCDLRR